MSVSLATRPDVRDVTLLFFVNGWALQIESVIPPANAALNDVAPSPDVIAVSVLNCVPMISAPEGILTSIFVDAPLRVAVASEYIVLNPPPVFAVVDMIVDDVPVMAALGGELITGKPFEKN